MSEPVKTLESTALGSNPFTDLAGPIREAPAEKPEGHSDARWLGNRWWIPNENWRTLEGMLKDSGEDTSAEKARERAWELEHDDRKSGRISQS